MLLHEHPDFSLMAPYIRIELYGRDGGDSSPRRRIELSTVGVPAHIYQQALAIRINCCACGKEIEPFRARTVGPKRGAHKHIYVAVACPLNVQIGCSRGNAARDAYLSIEEALKKISNP